jgi:hypothetical protein
MRTYRMDTLGSLDGLVAHEEPTPAPGPGEVLVRVKATALNVRDIFTIKGQSPFPVKTGVVPMSDAADGHHLIPRVAYGRLRMTEVEPFEGAAILEVPTFEEAEAWYDSPAYQAAVVHRFRGAKYRTFIVQGVS